MGRVGGAAAAQRGRGLLERSTWREGWRTSAAAPPLLLLALLVLRAPPGAQALTESLEIWAVDPYSSESLVSFGFEEGGSYTVRFEITKANEIDDLDEYTAQSENSTLADRLLAAACTDAEMRALALAAPSKGRGGHALTPPCDMEVCSRVLRFEAPSLVMAETNVATGEYLTFVLLSCGAATVRGKASYTILNPGGAHLGTDIAPLPKVFFALLAGWSVVLLLWVYNLCKFRNHNVLLQRALTFVPVAKWVYVLLNTVYYQTGATTGDLPSSIFLFSLIVYILYKGAFFSTLLLIAKGWLISRPVLDESEKRSLFCTVMVFCGMLVAFLFFSSFRTSFGLLLLCGCYFWIVHTAFNSSLRNVRALEMQIHMIRQSRIDPATTPVPARVAMFYKFRWYMSLFVFCDLIITIVITMVMVRMLWLDVALHQAIDLLFFVGVGWTFRMREFNPYFYEIPIAQADYAVPIAQPVYSNHTDDRSLQEWQVGQALPAAPAEMLYPEGATVVIEGPSTVDEAGNRIEGTVMVGRRQDVDTDWGDRSHAQARVSALPGQSLGSERYDCSEDESTMSTSSKRKKKKKKKQHREP